MIRYFCKTYVKLTSIPLNLQNFVGRTYFSCPELSQPLQKEPKWTTSEEAVKCIKSGNRQKSDYSYHHCFSRDKL